MPFWKSRVYETVRKSEYFVKQLALLTEADLALDFCGRAPALLFLRALPSGLPGRCVWAPAPSHTPVVPGVPGARVMATGRVQPAFCVQSPASWNAAAFTLSRRWGRFLVKRHGESSPDLTSFEPNFSSSAFGLCPRTTLSV